MNTYGLSLITLTKITWKFLLRSCYDLIYIIIQCFGYTKYIILYKSQIVVIQCFGFTMTKEAKPNPLQLMSQFCVTDRQFYQHFRFSYKMIDVLRPLLCTCQAKWADRLPEAMKRSQRRTNFQICPARESNSGGSDLWSNALLIAARMRLIFPQNNRILYILLYCKCCGHMYKTSGWLLLAKSTYNVRQYYFVLLQHHYI